MSRVQPPRPDLHLASSTPVLDPTPQFGDAFQSLVTLVDDPTVIVRRESGYDLADQVERTEELTRALFRLADHGIQVAGYGTAKTLVERSPGGYMETVISPITRRITGINVSSYLYPGSHLPGNPYITPPNDEEITKKIKADLPLDVLKKCFGGILAYYRDVVEEGGVYSAGVKPANCLYGTKPDDEEPDLYFVGTTIFSADESFDGQLNDRAMSSLHQLGTDIRQTRGIYGVKLDDLQHELNELRATQS